MSIREWPADDRPREKMMKLGPEALTDSELLAIILRTGVQGMNVLQLAREILQKAGGLGSLLSMDQQGFCTIKGLGPAKFVQLQATMELARRALLETSQRSDALTSATASKRFLQAKLQGYRYEVFACLWLDNQHRVIRFEELFRGTIDGASVYPREVVQAALRENAAAVIFAHNHPSGVAEPSEADRQITSRLQKALSLVEIRVLDHVVVGQGEVVSFAERCWI